MQQNPNTTALSDAGVSIWLDDLSRDRLASGNLRELINTRNVVGVATNPTIFAAALADGEAYAEQLRELKRSGADVGQAIAALTTSDVRTACDLFVDQYRASAGYDGRVSLEVEPTLADDTAATITRAQELRTAVDRENVLIKIPATGAGLPAITATIAAGVSVNVTLIFSPERYRQVAEAYLTGLEEAAAAGRDLSSIHSVSSIFVSRIDTDVDRRLEALATSGALPAPEARSLTGRAAIANARVAHQVSREVLSSQRWHELAAQGANQQRLLWASTKVKSPALPDTTYVTELVTRGVVNTMPEVTLQAVADHGLVRGDTVVAQADEAHETLAALAAAGIDLDDVFTGLERAGVEAFVTSWHDLRATVMAELDRS